MEPEEKVHPKRIGRDILTNLPPGLEPELRLTIMTLWCYSHGFHTVEDLDSGHIRFSGSISYNQIARACGRSYNSARNYCARLNDLKMLTWTVGKHWIEFTVCVAAAQAEFQDADVQNRFDDSGPMTIWKPSDVEGDFGRPVAAGTIRYVGGRCPYCRWNQAGTKREAWCDDCYAEATEPSEGVSPLQWGIGEEYCPSCGEDNCWGCDADSARHGPSQK
jgi:hypothetical protein